MFCGMMTGMMSLTLVPQFLIMLFVLTAYISCIFVLPFFSMKIRPLPIAFLALVLLSYFIHSTILKYLSESDAKWSFSTP
eukprot:UN05827